MFTHKQVWDAIDALAAKHGVSTSALAKLAGLDATTFNRSKRVAPTGHMRWPTTESIARVLDCTKTPVAEFAALLAGKARASEAIPLIGLAQAGGGGFFDDAGFPVGSGWEQIAFPKVDDPNAYALEIAGDSMVPVYRDGDVIVVSPNAQVRRGDRIVAKTRDGQVLAKVLSRQTARTVELSSFNPDHPPLTLSSDDVVWMARIVWASQ
ncbi:MAG: helix-turn-helix transcriptional regulator [Hyphomicrobiales bacterium]